MMTRSRNFALLALATAVGLGSFGVCYLISSFPSDVESALASEMGKKRGSFWENALVVRSVECRAPQPESVDCTVRLRKSFSGKTFYVSVIKPPAPPYPTGFGLFPAKFSLEQEWHDDQNPFRTGYQNRVKTDLDPEFIKLESAVDRLAYVADRAVERAISDAGEPLQKQLTAYLNAQSYK